MNLRRPLQMLAALCATLVFPAQLLAQHDGRCEALVPDTAITRSQFHATPFTCELQCYFETTPLLCTGSIDAPICVPGDPQETHQAFAVDDCDAEPIIRRLDGVPRNSLDANLLAALESLEAQAIEDTIAVHDLPATDIGRVKRLLDFARGEVRSRLYVRLMDTALLDPAARTPEQQLITEAYADEWHRFRIHSIELARQEYDEWVANPCTYVAPEGFEYVANQTPACTPPHNPINLFSTIPPPTLADFLAYGLSLASEEFIDPSAELALGKTARSLQIAAATATTATGVSVAAAAVIALTANFIFPFVASGVATFLGPTLVATIATLAGGFLTLIFGVVLIIIAGVVIAVVQGVLVFEAAEIGPALDEALIQLQSRPPLLTVMADPRGQQEFFYAFMLTTLPDYHSEAEPPPAAPGDDWFIVTNPAGEQAHDRDFIPFVGWLQDPLGWTLRAGRHGWLIPEVHLQIPAEGIDERFSGQTLSIDYLGWRTNPNINQELSAWRMGQGFFILPRGGDPESDGWYSDELHYYDGAAPHLPLIATLARDNTPPSVIPQVSGALGSNGWYVSDVGLSWLVSDPDSDIVDTDPHGCPLVLVNNDGISHHSCTATSQGGETEGMVDIKRDATPPTITGNTTPPPGLGGWHNSDVAVSFSCSDFGPSGQDIAATGGGCGPGAAVTAETAGTDFTGTATDLAGNAETAIVTVRLDRTAPTINGFSSPAANGYGWVNSNVTVSFECSDQLSGVLSCANGWTFSGDGIGQSFTGFAEDFAGNSNFAVVSDIHIDKTPPVINLLTPSGTFPDYLLNEIVLADWTATDALSGLENATGTVPAGSAIDTSEAGEFIFDVQASDLAGNPSSLQHSYRVLSPEAAIEQLMGAIDALVDAGSMKDKDGKKLQKVLDKVLKELTKAQDGKKKPKDGDKACKELEKFLQEVEKIKPKDLAGEIASELLERARAISSLSMDC